MSRKRAPLPRPLTRAATRESAAIWDVLVPVMPVLALAWIAAASLWSAQVVRLI